MERIPYGEFGARFVEEAVSDERVASAIAEIAGDSVEVGPLAAGPGGLARVRARGRIGAPRVVAGRGSEPITFSASLPVELDLRVDVAGVSHRYDCGVQVELQLVVHTALPLAFVVDIDPVGPGDVAVSLDASGVRARVLQRIGDMDDEVRRQVAAFVNERIGSDTTERTRVIELLPLIDRAWD